MQSCKGRKQMVCSFSFFLTLHTYSSRLFTLLFAQISTFSRHCFLLLICEVPHYFVSFVFSHTQIIIYQCMLTFNIYNSTFSLPTTQNPPLCPHLTTHHHMYHYEPRTFTRLQTYHCGFVFHHLNIVRN